MSLIELLKCVFKFLLAPFFIVSILYLCIMKIKKEVNNEFKML
jgi:hypothetical protein